MQLYTQSVGQGQPLLFLHGLFGSADNWGSIARHFSAQYQVICADLRNHGRSPHAATQTLREMADDVLETLDALGLAQVCLIGHSLGGKVAMQCASQAPSRFSGLVVVDMAMRAYHDTHTPLINAMQAVDLRQMPSRSAVDKALSASIPHLMVRQFLLTNLVKQGEQLQWRIPLHALKANYPHFIAAMDAHFDGPSLFIHGARSDYVQPSDIAQLQQHFPQAKFVSLPTEHWVHAEQPDQFIATLEHFLQATIV